MSRFFTLRYVTLSYITLCYIPFHHTTPRRAALQHTTLPYLNLHSFTVPRRSMCQISLPFVTALCFEHKHAFGYEILKIKHKRNTNELGRFRMDMINQNSKKLIP